MQDKQTVLNLDWAFLVYWMVASTVGWLLGGFLVSGLSLLVTGLAIGALQWIPLEKRIPKASRWILATVTGWALAQIELVLINPAQNAFFTGVIVGLCVGIAQWLILRDLVRWPGWWVVINVVAWTTGFALLPGAINTGMLPGFITGVALDLLLKNSK